MQQLDNKNWQSQFILKTAIEIATDAHASQIDKLGEPYIFHPLRVMLKLQTHHTLENVILPVVGVLHDVLEDTIYNSSDLRDAKIPKEAIEALHALTKAPTQNYYDYIKKQVSTNEIAARVKLADLEDNLDPARLSKLDPVTAQRLQEKYTWAVDYLSKRI